MSFSPPSLPHRLSPCPGTCQGRIDGEEDCQRYFRLTGRTVTGREEREHHILAVVFFGGNKNQILSHRTDATGCSLKCTRHLLSTLFAPLVLLGLISSLEWIYTAEELNCLGLFGIVDFGFGLIFPTSSPLLLPIFHFSPILHLLV